MFKMLLIIVSTKMRWLSSPFL